MAINTYDVGDLVRVSGEFKASGGALSDPTVVYVKYKDPSGNETTKQYGVDAAVVKDATGQYHLDIDVDEAGTWYYRWYSTGTGQAAKEVEFIVDPSAFA